MDEYPTLHAMVKQSPYEVRHLLICSGVNSSTCCLIQLISGNKTEIGTGTEYEMGQKADALMNDWKREGFHLPGQNEQAWESLEATITLLRLMGYKVVYDPAYQDLRRGNATGAFPLDQWPGKQGKNGGGYHYAFTGTLLIAGPMLPPGHAVNLEPANSQEFVRTMQQAVTLQKTVGPFFELVLGR